MNRWGTVLILAALVTGMSDAAVIEKNITYQEGDTVLEGFLAYDDVAGKRPGVVLVHEWWGLTEHPKNWARRLASEGYVAFALDMYGKGNVTDDSQQAGKWAGQFYGDPALAERRFNAGLAVLRAEETVDASRVAAIGFCFGGTIVLEMARMGSDVNGVVSFHGGLASRVPEDQKNIKAAVLVCHGADDPHVSQEQLLAFIDEMKQAKANWQLDMYGGAVHSFTNPKADRETARYHERAAKRSWADMLRFFDEILRNRR